jgi:hypothetical protein
MRRVLILVGLAALASGCGSSTEDRPPYPHDGTDLEQVEAVVALFNEAAADLDAEVLCGEVIAPSARGGSVSACADRIQPAMDDSPENWDAPISDIGDLSIQGEKATAHGVQDGGEISLRFQREDDRWWMNVFD